MIITDITKTKRGRYSLFCDSEFVFSIDGHTLLTYGLRVGLPVSPDMLEEIKEKSDSQLVNNKAIQLLSMRAHSRYELSVKLRKITDNTDVINDILDSLEQTGVIDDKAFATAFADELLNIKKYGPSRIRMQLMSKGISRQIVDEVLLEQNDDVDSSMTMICDMIEMRYIEKIKTKKDTEKVISALIRRGYRVSDILTAVSIVRDKYEIEVNLYDD